MPDLPGRRDREGELTAAIRAALGDSVDQWSQGLDSPALRRTVASDVDQILGRAFADSAIATQQQLDLGIGGVDRAAQATGRALGVAVGFSVATSVARSFDGMPFDASRQELADAILASARWDRTAATSVTKAATAGSQYVASTWVTLSGLLVRTIWRTSADARVCPICAPLDGSPQDVYSIISPDGPPAHPTAAAGSTTHGPKICQRERFTYGRRHEGELGRCLPVLPERDDPRQAEHYHRGK